MNTHDIELPQGYTERPFDYSGDLQRKNGPVAYHPCTSILIEGLKRLPGGSAILAEWDKARYKVDAPQPAEPATDRYELALDALADLLEEAEWLQRDLNIERAKNGLAPIEEGNPIINARRLLAANVPSNQRGTSASGRALYEEP